MVSRLPPLGDGGVVVWATTQNLLAVGSAFSAVEYQLDVVRCYSYTAWGGQKVRCRRTSPKKFRSLFIDAESLG